MAESDRSASSPLVSDLTAPRSVLMAVPRWTRDGGVSAHVQTSAAILARHGLDVRVVAARIESTDEVPGVTLYRCPDLFHEDVPMEARLGEALAFGPDVVHLHHVERPDIAQAMRMSAPLVISAHNYVACPSGKYYFRPGQECTRAHGPGCILNMIARGCAHTHNPKSLPTRYRSAARGAEALELADLVVSYSSSVDRHLAANGLPRRKIIPLSTTIPPSRRQATPPVGGLCLQAGWCTRRASTY